MGYSTRFTVLPSYRATASPIGQGTRIAQAPLVPDDGMDEDVTTWEATRQPSAVSCRGFPPGKWA